MRTTRQPTTRHEIDDAIHYQRSIISECETCIDRGEKWNFENRDFNEVIQTASDRIQALRQLRESIARPFEKARPVTEQQLHVFGVIPQ